MEKGWWEALRKLRRKSIVAVECASLKGLIQAFPSEARSTRPNRRGDGLASGIRPLRLAGRGVQLWGAHSLLKRAMAGLGAHGTLLRGWLLRIRTRWSGRSPSCGRFP